MREIRKIVPRIVGLIQRKRVAAYARVSSGKETMLHSLSTQVSYYNDYIGKRGDWQFAGIYVDKALTGTKDTRPEFQRLLADCRAGKIDLVIAKSIARFARNTVTLLQTVRELKNLGVEVYFERENIYSMSGDGELMLSILASYAQEESRSVSESCKWRIRKKFEKGRPNIGKLLGYRLRDGVFIIVPEEAEIVKQIFSDYLLGMGLIAIRKKLLNQGVQLSKRGISNILQNEKYVGDLLLQKTFTENHISKKKMINLGQLPKYFVEAAHQPIISHETFDMVQAEMQRRSCNYTPKSSNIAAYPFTGLVKCGQCGANYHRKHTAAGTKYEKVVWICDTYNTLGKGRCPSQQIPENILEAKVEEAGGIQNIAQILVPDKNLLTFIFKDNSSMDIQWQNPSRSESWTEEMKQAARDRHERRYKK